MMQRQRARPAAVGTAVALGACVLCIPAPVAPVAIASVAPLLPACIEYAAIARGRNLGYDHIVRVRSECAASAACLVATNVDPKPVEARVPPRSEVEVVTRVGSPAREFVPIVSCSLP